ncbi:hypothetical protein NPX13_g6219 [Xylaria arbuscula]|uniref:Mid2 domain-containing protein n=1 Tax=Xylaria arbuscula TaxID=114810 RepID=A0A9W8NC98_9PEZI|nr:hypothetical protein NPX13_g6219 [Xylaria arbuscula]
MRFSTAVFFSLSSFTHAAGVGFISPDFQATTERGKYAGNSQWPLGSTQVVAFTTPWDVYRLELWQQSLAGGSASRSSMFSYKQMATGKILPQSFQWTVQTYELQLSKSPIFFFWLFNGTDSDAQQSSAYFNITIDSSSASTNSPSGKSTSSASTEPSVTTFTPPSSIDSSTSISATATSLLVDPDNAPTGLSAGAKAGVGVGASLGGILILAIAGVLLWKRKRSNKEQQRAAELQDSQSMGYSYRTPSTVVETVQYTPKPAEAPSYYELPPTELGA